MTNPDYDEESCANEHQNDEQQNNDEENVEKTHPLDAFVNTGVYIEEDKEHGDLLIVLGEDYLPEHLRQFYLSANEDKIFTRILSKSTWSAWFVVESAEHNEPELNFDDKNTAALIKIQKVLEYTNAPDGFTGNHQDSPSLLICLSLEDQKHTIQFLTAETRRHFWIRHYMDGAWSSWESFM